MTKPLDFVTQALKSESDDCINWPFAKDRYGYGSLRYLGKTHRAYRLVCIKKWGTAPDGKNDAAHICGNPSCVNPRHLKWKSRQENEADKVRQGRNLSGGRHWLAKWPDTTRKQIVDLFRTGINVREISLKLNIPRTTVSNIVHRDWKRAKKRTTYLSLS